MKRILTLLLMIVAFYSSKAQWVSIPDSNFGKWLTNSYPTCMQGNPQVGFQMDTSCGAILNDSFLFCTNNSIEDLAGIQYFKSLKTLYVYCNKITSLPFLPPQLISLNSSCNQLTLLSNLPNTLKVLDVSHNQISLINAFPDSLIYLDCSLNTITSLPSLPINLSSFGCNGNQLVSLPNLPSTLSILTCTDNKLTFLPNLPPFLQFIDCNYNQISAIPVLPSSLTHLFCRHNSIKTLPNLPSNLTKLYCDNNLLTFLPNLPSSLTSLSCLDNYLDSLPNLPNSITYLGCSGNRLTFILKLPNSVDTLNCSFNSLSSLPALPNHLMVLFCDSNHLTSLPNLPNSLKRLSCSRNRLTSLTNLPDSLYDFDCSFNPSLACLPKLNNYITYFNATGTSIKCIPNVPKNGFGWWSNHVCDIKSGCPVYWNISGNVHKDTATTCLQDSLYPEKILTNLKVILSQGGITKDQMYVTPFGQYSFETDSFSTYEVTIDTTDLPIQVKCPSSGVQSVDITTLDSIKGDVNFGIECKGYDVGVNSIYNRFRAGRQSQIIIHAGDLLDLGCTGNSSAIVTTSISGSVHYISPAMGALTPSSFVSNTLTYNIADVSTIKSATDFNIMVQTDTNAVLGSSICVTTTIHTPSPDYIPANDSLTICFPVVNSFDPNEKTVYPKNISQDATWLNYTIQFQNTGNDTAYDIVIRDTLSTNLDIETFQYLASSHSPIVQVKGREAIFTFANINLLDSFHNEPQSHGWLQYRIKTKANLPLQSQIKNTAYIYFDFNSPVVTNTTLNTVDVTGISDIQKAEPFLALYPNPANSLLNISTNSLHPKSLTIYDASGRKVSEQVFATSLDISSLSQGIYLLEVKSEEGIARRRFVRQ